MEYNAPMKCLGWLSLFVLLSACAESPVAPPLETTALPIVNGTRSPQAIPLSAGEILAVGFLHQAGFPSANFCTGTLISPRVVATASHCTEDQWAGNVGFGVGTTPSQARASVGVAEIHNHPFLDAAILILEQDMTTLVPELQPVAFNRESMNGWQGRQVEAGGFGETRDPSRDGRWFAVLTLESVGQDYITVNGNGQRGICFGDSGGPVFSTDSQGRPIQLAVESNGDSSCVGRDNMTRLDRVQDWIEQVAGQHLREDSNPPRDDPPQDDPPRNDPPQNDPPQDDPPSGDSCGGVDYAGQCNGDVAQWCYQGELEERDCAALGTNCRYIDENYGHICDCGDLGSAGRCNGDIAEYCVGGRLSRTDCRSQGQVCGASSGGGFGCTDTPNCGNVDAVGHCIGEAVVRCEGGRFSREDCGQYGATCVQEAGAAAICSRGGGGETPENKPPEDDSGGNLVGGGNAPGFVDDGQGAGTGDLSWQDGPTTGAPQAACDQAGRTRGSLRWILRR